jgi:transposase
MKRDAETQQALTKKYKVLAPVLDERARRRWAGMEAKALGYGGVSVVSAATGIARETIRHGISELGETDTGTRLRRPGAGRKRLADKDPGLKVALERLVEPLTRGDPMSPLRWTCKSVQNLASALKKQGHKVSPSTVGRLLYEMGYSMQSVRKTKEGTQHPDRNAQFEHINATVEDFQARGQPAVSVDTKKKELIGDFKNAGREWQPQGEPETADVHDFPTDAVGKAIPYGVYDVARNEAWVSVGDDHDTPAFAVASIRQWWRTMGEPAYPDARQLLITADAGGSNGYRARAWKAELQAFADETKLEIRVCHFPPGTSKWNKIEHRLFCHITRNWRGKPLTTFESIVSLIGATRTTQGLRVKARRDHGTYPTGVEISKDEMKRLNIRPSDFHGEWNYSVVPRVS